MVGETFGQALRRLRETSGLSLRRLNARTGYDYSYLAHVEHGRQPGSLALAEACDHALNAGGQLVARFTAATTPQEDLDPMLRRTFLAGSAGILAVGAIGSVGPTRRVSPTTVEDLRAVAAAYRRSYRAVPATQLLAAAHAHLELAASLQPGDQPEPIRAGLVSTVGEMAALATTIFLLDLGNAGACGPYLEMLWRAARATGSPELLSVALAGRSFVAAYGPARNHRQGLEYAELACETAATGACRETSAWVAAVASERHASLGNLSACQRRMDDSRAALDGVADDGPQWLGIGVFDDTKLLAYRGGNMVRLQRWADAEPVLDQAVERFTDDMVRHRCTALLDRAEARLGAGDVDAACVDATESLDLVAEVQHAQNLGRLDAMSTRAAATGAAAGKALRRQVTAVKAETAGTLTVGR